MSEDEFKDGYRYRPGRPEGAVERPSRFPSNTRSVWRFCVGARDNQTRRLPARAVPSNVELIDAEGCFTTNVVGLRSLADGNMVQDIKVGFRAPRSDPPAPSQFKGFETSDRHLLHREKSSRARG